jgi:ketosteroid isomerase-like protein
MKNTLNVLVAFSIGMVVILTSSFVPNLPEEGAIKNTATSGELYNTILALDQRFFDAYNSCDMETQAELLADAIEFYHDQGGLSTSKEDILKGTKENICGKVTRTLVPGGLEVSPIPGYGAAAVGLQKFKNKEEPEGTLSKESRFVAIWKKTNNQWQMTRIISLH